MSVITGTSCHLDHAKGQIQLIFGPMFSGKTTELIRRMKRYQLANHKCLMIKYARDLRYESGASVATHDRQTLAALPATQLGQLRAAAEQCSVIGIDEGQFFPDVVDFAEAMANLGKTVIVAALDGTYKRSGFGEILNLVPLAEQVVKLTAVCMLCYGEAAYTQRLGSETEVEVIGGTEKYMAVCRECYNKCNSTTTSCDTARSHGNRISSPFKEIANTMPLNDLKSLPLIGSHHCKSLHF